MKVISLIVVSILLIWVLYSWLSTRNLEEPAFAVIEKRDDFEIRLYEPYIIAEVTVDGAYGQGLNNGFRLVADYIFGNNTSKDKIAMTAPVTDTPSSEKIAMTVPVLDTVGAQRKVSFVMPSQYTMDALPKPNNPAVVLKEIPGYTAAVKKFSWYPSGARVTLKEQELRQSLSVLDIDVAAPASRAFYNAPGTFPLLLRNEIIIPISLES